MDTLMLLYYLSGFPREMLLALLVFVLPLRPRKKWPLRLLPVALAIAGCVGLGALLWNPVYGIISGQLFFAFYYLLICLILTCSVRFVFHASWMEACYCTVCTYIAEHICYCIENLLVHFLAFPVSKGSFPIYMLYHLPVYVAIHFLFARRMSREGHYATNTVQSVGLMSVVFVLVYVISVTAIDMQLEWFHAMYALICCFAMLISEYRYTRRIYMENEFRTKEHMWQMSKAQYEMTAEHIELINRKCHDLKHQINALRQIDDRHLRNEAIGSMEEAVMIYDSSFKTGSNTLDMVLTQKALRCKEAQIPLSVMADGALLRFIDDIDLYTMMANILDNAIEANEHIQDVTSRGITLTIHERKGLVIIQAENPYTGKLTMRNGLPVTIKADRTEHGFGTRSIVYTAEKYGGILSIDCKHQMFVLRIVFPNADANQDKNLHN